MIAAGSMHVRPKCRLAWFSQQSICKLFHKYSLIAFNGDSLTRHLYQGVFMIFKEDWRYGAFPYYRIPHIYDQCGCDGQYSEAELCRNWWSSPDAAWRMDYRAVGVCGYFDTEKYNSVNKTALTQFDYYQTYNFFHTDLTCDDIKKRPIFLQIQGGAHYEMNSTKFALEYMTPIMHDVEERFKNCINQVKVVYRGTTVCAPDLERRYPTQEAHLSDLFNQQMKSWLHKHYPYVVFLNPWSITKEAVNRTSDGFHFLSDTNMLFGLTMLNLMNIMVD